MATTNYYLKDLSNKKKETLIYLFFSYDGKRLKYSTKEKVPPNYWNKDKQRVKKSYTGSIEINALLKRIEEEVLKIYRHSILKGDALPVLTLREELNEALNREPKDKLTFFNILDEFIETSSPKVKPRTIQKYNTLKSHLQNFEKQKRYALTFDAINLVFFDKFERYMLDDLQLLNNSFGKYIGTLKTFLNWAFERGYNQNSLFKKFKVYKKEADIVYLEFKELIQLFNYDFSNNKRLEKVRDAFCLGCFTGLRFSDLKNINANNIKGNFIVLNIFKTKETLKIPLNNFAKTIIEKYIDQPQFLDVISNQKMNTYLKEACAVVGFDTPVTLTKFRGVQRIESTQPKHELISTHTARRTFVTLSLEKGMRHEIVMRITGHKTYKSFKRYIKLTDKIKALEMSSVWDEPATYTYDKDIRPLKVY